MTSCSREAMEKLIQRHASAYVARGAAISDSIIAECKAARAALWAALSGSAAQTAAKHHEPEVFLFYRDKHLHHIHTDRKVFEDWMEKSPWQYPPDRCEIVRYIPSVVPSTDREGT